MILHQLEQEHIMNIFEINQAIIAAAVATYGFETEQENGALDVVYLENFEVQLIDDTITLLDSATDSDVASFNNIEDLIAHLKNVIGL